MDFSAAMLGFKEFQIAFTAIKIGLPALLAREPRTSAQLAQSTGIPETRLLRLLHAMVWCDILKITEDGSYALAPAGSELVDDRPNSTSDDFRFQGEFLYRAFGEMHQFLLDGSIPFNTAHGQGIFESLAANPELARLYAIPMAQRCTEYSGKIAQHSALDGAKTIADVAGGAGQLVIDILKHRTTCRGMILDLPYIREPATSAIAAAGLSDRCQFKPCDIFRSIPTGADLYLLKWILHDFDDAQCVTILKCLADAMANSGRLIIIERLLPNRISSETGLVQGDLNMLCLSGGAERTLDQYRNLCNQARLKLGECSEVETYYGFHMMQVSR